MFTGLVQKIGTLAAKKKRTTGLSLIIRHEPWDTPLALGESVAVQGACLTVTAVEKGEFACDVLKETLDKTSIGPQGVGTMLNLERALRADERLGGHIVTGHIDGLGTVASWTRAGADRVLEVSCDQALLEGIVPKGSIAIDGVSLTIAELRPGSFTVHLIPHTLAGTSLRNLKQGMRVNLETDIIGKYVRRYVSGAKAGGPLTIDTLRAAGFGV